MNQLHRHLYCYSETYIIKAQFEWFESLLKKKLTNFYLFFYLQLSELEQRVIEAEERADEAEDKVIFFFLKIRDDNLL